jgi:hypothetical protein
MYSKENLVEIIYKGVTFYFRTDRNNMLWLETDGHPVTMKGPKGFEVLMEVKQFLLDNQSEEDKEYQAIVATNRHLR